MLKLHLISYLFLAGCALTGASITPKALASSAEACPFQTKIVAQESSSDFKIEFEDKEITSNACEYQVRRFEYFPAINTVVIDFMNEPCLVDRIGKRKGTFKWTQPLIVRDAAKLCLIIDQKKCGGCE